MDEIFFVRFSLQQSIGIFGENQFTCDDIIAESKEQIAQYIAECKDWQEEQAKELRAKYDTIGKLSGKKVLYVGDSLTADRLSYRGITTEAANLDAHSSAVSGATSIDMLRSIYGELRKAEPEIVSILIGNNDCFFVGGKEKVNLVSKEEYQRNLKEMITICKQYGAFVMVVTLQDTYYANDEIKENNTANIAEYNSIIQNVVKETDAVLVDLNHELKIANAEKELEPDGVHLNKKAQRILADLWLKTLIENVGM